MKIRYFLIAALLIALYGWVGAMDAEEEQRQQDRYCEMVELYEETNGDAGWPAYKGKCDE